MKLHWLLLGVCAFASASQGSSDHLLHLDPEMTGYEYRALWDDLIAKKKRTEISKEDSLEPVVAVGRRNLAWIDAINAHRTDNNKLELSTPDTQVGIPITAPRESNRQIVEARHREIRNALPESMRQVLYGTAPLPTEPGVADDVFLMHVRKLDHVYQAASRWLLQEPFLSAYALLATKDIRGYYFLSREQNLATTLRSWGSQTAEVKARLTPWLLGQCRNGEISMPSCQHEFDTAARGNDVTAFYQRHRPAAEHVWRTYFALQNPRPDAEFSENDENLFVAQFLRHERDDVGPWLVENIEDEWRHEAFQLRLQFMDSGSSLPHIVFEPGATPHVNALGGNEITMDANRNIQEYTTKWTIRHEYGHVLGFPDCYSEFYDTARGVMINYQIDIDNLMCSRRGHLQGHHIESLRNAYSK